MTNKTPLVELHRRLGARMTEFAGWFLPLAYPEGTLHEYWAARGEDGAALFDVSHMGRIWLRGQDALAFTNFIACNDAAKLAHGHVQYSALLNEQGGFLDDITVHREQDHAFMLCVNAANRARVLGHLEAHAARFAVQVEDVSDATAQLALQGPAAERLLAPLVDDAAALAALGYYRFARMRMLGEEALIARTGYTGEDGFELYLPAEAAARVFERLVEAGATPAGLAARDLLRTEMGYALYGHEIDEDTTPFEAGLGWIVAMDKPEFIGKEALSKRRKHLRKRLVGLVVPRNAGIPRAGFAVVDAKGQEIGRITSGAFSPKLGQGVALAHVVPEHAGAAALGVVIRGRIAEAKVQRPPFVPPRTKRTRKGGAA